MATRTFLVFKQFALFFDVRIDGRFGWTGNRLFVSHGIAPFIGRRAHSLPWHPHAESDIGAYLHNRKR